MNKDMGSWEFMERGAELHCTHGEGCGSWGTEVDGCEALEHT